MRIVQARWVGLAFTLAAAVLLGVFPGIAQQGGQTGGGGAAAPSPGKGSPTPTPSRSTIQNRDSTNTPQVSRPIWLSGRVVMSDGGAPPESVTIERLCSSNSAHPEGYTDSKGHFSFNLGQNNGIFADASTSSFGDPGMPGGFGAMSGNSGGATTGSTRSGNPDSAYWDCELRARLPGYRSDTLSLAGRRMLDNPDVGVIVLYPISKIQGLTASATTGQAPKDSRKAYQRGLDAVRKNRPEQAEQEFRKAVQLYPRHAAAWLELGRILEQKQHDPEAREAYARSLAADSKFVYPYQQLYQMALREQNWQDLAEKTDQLTHLNPYEFPSAFYFNALAHLQLKEYDAAEKSAQQAVQADLKKANPKTHYLLGAIQVQKKNWTGAAESFRAYLTAAPNATDKAQVVKTLGQLDQQIGRTQTASQDSAAQQ